MTGVRLHLGTYLDKVGDALVTVLIYHARAYGFDSHRRKPSEQNGQSHWLSPANIEGGKIRVSHQGVPMYRSLPKMSFGNAFLNGLGKII